MDAGIGFIVGFQSRSGSDGSGSGTASPGDVWGAGPLYSGEWKEIWPLDQSIDGLYCLSQLYPRTAKQEESSDVT